MFNLLIIIALFNTGLRDHEYELQEPRVRRNARTYFSIRVTDTWNSLSDLILQCTTIRQFKKRIDCYLYNRGYY